MKEYLIKYLIEEYGSSSLRYDIISATTAKQAVKKVEQRIIKNYGKQSFILRGISEI